MNPTPTCPAICAMPTATARGFGHGAGYLYPHAYRDHWVAQQYLPAALQGKVFYEPTDQGYEAAIAAAVTRRRVELSWRPMLEGSGAPPEILTYDASGDGSARERWLQRTVAQSGEAAAALRERILAGGPLERHSVVLDLNVGSGLLTWEALRRARPKAVSTPWRTTRTTAGRCRSRCKIWRSRRGRSCCTDEWVRWHSCSTPIQCVSMPSSGRNALLNSIEKEAALRQLAERLAPDGWLSLAETVPKHTQRIYALGDRSTLRPELAERLIAAEEAIYADSADALVNWDEDRLEAALFAAFPAQAQSGRVSIERIDADTDVLISEGMVRRWFGPALGDRRSYAERLAEGMGPEEVEQIEGWVRGQLLNRTVPWRRRTVLLRVAAR